MKSLVEKWVQISTKKIISKSHFYPIPLFCITKKRQFEVRHPVAFAIHSFVGLNGRHFWSRAKWSACLLKELSLGDLKFPS